MKIPFEHLRVEVYMPAKDGLVHVTTALLQVQWDEGDSISVRIRCEDTQYVHGARITRKPISCLACLARGG